MTEIDPSWGVVRPSPPPARSGEETLAIDDEYNKAQDEETRAKLEHKE
jgi:hypothetical protein